MRVNLVDALSEFGSILAICPCCGDVIPLSEARPYVKGRKPKSKSDSLEQEEARVDRAEKRLHDREDELRDAAREKGRRQAKRHLKKIDPTFSGWGIDRQDIKVIFDPVEYVVFDGFNRRRLKKIAFVAYPPANKSQAKIQRSISNTINAVTIVGMMIRFHVIERFGLVKHPPKWLTGEHFEKAVQPAEE